MKPLIIRIILSVTGYTVPTAEIESRLSVIAPIQIEVIDIANPQPVESFYPMHYSLVRAHVKNDIVVYLHPAFIGGLSGGKCTSTHKVGTVAILADPDYAERDLRVTLHEIGHKWGLGHNLKECSIMSPQPCSLEFTANEIKKAKRWARRK